MQKVIALFVLENVGAMSGEEAASQRASMSGIWDMDVTAFKNYPGYENASMNMQLSKAGTGKSYVDMTGTGAFMLASEYPFYIYATDKKDNVESGVYIVESEDEGVKTAAYEIAENDGKRVLTFTSPEGVIKYYYRCGLTPESVSISKAKVKGSKKLALSWNSVENADGYVILLSSNSKFKKARTVTVEGKTSAKLKKLKKKTYYVKVCAYTEDYSGEKVFGEYSDVKEIEVK
ncbi:MAG: hypothetical protein K6E85_05760 [Lachnospiraceae bacterium]|nr:hypothetical protein [Lachnospiraceae bacterium]